MKKKLYGFIVLFVLCFSIVGEEYKKITYPSGDVYEGYVLWGKDRHGWGRLTYKDGGYQVGIWKWEDFYEGQGRVIYDNGSVFEGEWEEYGYSVGKLSYSNGGYLEGIWTRGLFEGEGKEIYNDGVVYEGEFKNGKKNGLGKMTWPDGTFYEGEFINDNLAQGRMVFPNGGYEEGIWENNNFIRGKAKYNITSGGHYEGKVLIKDNKYDRNGEGIFTDKEGITTRNIWKDNKIIETLPIISNEAVEVLKRKIDEIDFNIVWEFDGQGIFDNFFDLFYDKELYSLIAMYSKEMSLRGFEKDEGIYEVIYNDIWITFDNVSSGVEVNNWEPLYLSKEESSKQIQELIKTSKYNYNYILVKMIPDEDSQVLGDSQLTSLEKIKQYALNLTAREIIPSIAELKTPVFITPTFTKGEFETTMEFEKRKQSALAQFEKDKTIKLEKIAEKEKIYNKELKKLDDAEYVKKVYEKNLKKAAFIVLGKPYIKSATYDADSQMMKLNLFSAIDTNFTCDVGVSIPVNNAKESKEKLSGYTLVPSVVFNKNMEFLSAKLNTNNPFVKAQFESVKKDNQVYKYKTFLEKNPNTPEAILVQNEIDKIEKENKAEQLAKEKKEKEEQLAEEKALKQKKIEDEKAFSVKKKVGDKVQIEANGMWAMFGEVYIIRGQVSKVSGDRILVKITNTGGATSLNGDKIYVGQELWDNYYNWMKK